MTLTPADVESKTFPLTNRLQQGYDPAEVDAFLDEVQAELGRLYDENEELRQQLSARPESQGSDSGARGTQAGAGTGGQGADLDTAEPDLEPDRRSGTDAGAAGAAGQPAGDQLPAGYAAQPGEGPDQAAWRVLMQAQRTADATVAEAQAEAEAIREDTRRRSEELEQQIAQQREQEVGRLEQRRSQLLANIEELRAFDHEVRSQLRTWFSEQLHELDARPEPPAPQMDTDEYGGGAGDRTQAGPFAGSTAGQQSGSAAQPQGAGSPAGGSSPLGTRDTDGTARPDQR